MGLKYVGSVMRLDPGYAELCHDDGPALVNGKAALQAKILDVAAAEDRVLAPGLLVKKDRPQFRQRARVFKEERIADRRNKTVKFMVAHEELMRIGGVEAALAEPRKTAAEILALGPEARTALRPLSADAAIVGLRASRTRMQ